MNAWLIGVVALLPAFAVPLGAACRGHIGGRFAAVQFATAIATLVLIMMTFAFYQPALIDLALTLALLGLPGTLAIALFVERWL